MKRYLAFVTLILTSLPGFGSHAQPSRWSQFGVKSNHTSHKTDSKPHGYPGTGSHEAAQRPADTGCSARRKMNSTSATTINFLAAGRSPLGGRDDDNTEAIMGDFNGDGKMDVAKIVTNGACGQTVQIAALLGNGDGTFQAAQLTNTPANSDDLIVTGDLRGNKQDDIIQIHPAINNGCDAQSKARIKAQPQGGAFTCGSSMDVMLSNGDGTFATPVNYTISFSFLAGGFMTDVNGDGKLDVLVFDQNNPADVIALLGNGDGTFQAPTTLGQLAGPAPGGMIFADFNGDGNIDFAGFGNSGQILVTLATGAGLFANAPVSLAAENGINDGCNLATGDLTGDGKPEIETVNCNPDADTVTVYVNNGDGSFQKGVLYNSNFDRNNFPSGIAVADVNGDGKGDVVVSNPATGNISVLLGHGDGTLDAEALSYNTGGNDWNTPLIADFNGDGLPDVVISDNFFNLVYLQGYGDGSFRASPAYEPPNAFGQGPSSFSVATGDFNGDGIPDVVVGQVTNFGSTGVVVYLGKGDGTFFPGDSYGGGDPFLGNVVVADFNGDGKLDIAASDSQDGIVQILMGNGDGTFSVGEFYPTDSASNPVPVSMVTGDFNHDGKIDLAFANQSTGTIGVLLGNGDGTFGSFASYPITGQNPQVLTAADVDGDGFLDLEAGCFNGEFPQVAILTGKTDSSGTFNTPTLVSLNGLPTAIAVGDVNNDGKADMAVTEFSGITFNGQIEVFIGGSGMFASAPTAYAASAFGFAFDATNPQNLQLTDINGDGNLDLVYLNGNYGTLAIATGNGDGTFNAPVEFPASESAHGLALADLNQDGAVDAIAGNGQAGGMDVMLNGSGTGTAPNYTLGTQTPSQTVAAGSSATYTLNLAGINGYNGTITFTCSGLPAGATCSFSPASVVANGAVPLTTMVTIQTTTFTAGLRAPGRPGEKPGSGMLLASLSGVGLFGMVLMAGGKPVRRRGASIIVGVMLLLMTLTLVGCDKDAKLQLPTGTASGAYVVTVTSTGTGTSAPTHSLGLTLVVN